MTVSSVSPCVGDLGNTKRGPQSKRWAFTVNNYEDQDVVSLVSGFQAKAAKWIIAREVGASGTPHLQGFVEWKVRNYGSALSNLTRNRSHNEVCKGSVEQNGTYCSKDGEILSEYGMPRRVKVIQELYGWQQELWDLLGTEADDRTVHWVWSAKGNNGKTALCKKICVEKNAILVGGKAADAKCAVAALENKPDIILMNVARSCIGISYTGIEELKDGIFFSPKYESGMVIMPNPHVVVFANHPPDYMKLSQDRWNVVCLDEVTG